MGHLHKILQSLGSVFSCKQTLLPGKKKSFSPYTAQDAAFFLIYLSQLVLFGRHHTKTEQYSSGCWENQFHPLWSLAQNKQYIETKVTFYKKYVSQIFYESQALFSIRISVIIRRVVHSTLHCNPVRRCIYSKISWIS